MNKFTIALLIDYLYNRYFMIFFICLIGSLIHDLSDTIRNLSQINYRRALASSIFSAIVLSAIIDTVNWNFSVCVLVCFLTGMWSFKLLELAMNWKAVKTLLINILKNSKNIIGEAVVDTAKDLEEDDNSPDKKSKTDTKT